MPQSENRPPLVIRHVDVGALVRAVEQPDEPQDMGDALALDTAVVSYRFRWNAFLATPDGAA